MTGKVSSQDISSELNRIQGALSQFKAHPFPIFVTENEIRQLQLTNINPYFL
jgi:hypothetical protein